MPEAIRFGMPINEFWYGDIELLDCYKTAYYRQQSYSAWLQGQYNFVAFSVVISNVFAKHGDKKAEYPDWEDPIKEPSFSHITKDNAEYEYRKLQAEQNAWLFNT